MKTINKVYDKLEKFLLKHYLTLDYIGLVFNIAYIVLIVFLIVLAIRVN